MKKLVVINWANPMTRESGTVSENGAYKTFDSKQDAEKFIVSDKNLPVKGDKFQIVYEVAEIWMRTKSKSELQKVDTSAIEVEKTSEKAAESLDNAKMLVEKTVEAAVQKVTAEKNAEIEALKAKLAEKPKVSTENEDTAANEENSHWGGNSQKVATKK